MKIQNFLLITEFLTHVSELSTIRYENNNFYKYHADDNQTSLRRLSGIYFPNDDYEGGGAFYR